MVTKTIILNNLNDTNKISKKKPLPSFSSFLDKDESANISKLENPQISKKVYSVRDDFLAPSQKILTEVIYPFLMERNIEKVPVKDNNYNLQGWQINDFIYILNENDWDELYLTILRNPIQNKNILRQIARDNSIRANFDFTSTAHTIINNLSKYISTQEKHIDIDVKILSSMLKKTIEKFLFDYALNIEEISSENIEFPYRDLTMFLGKYFCEVLVRSCELGYNAKIKQRFYDKILNNTDSAPVFVDTFRTMYFNDITMFVKEHSDIDMLRWNVILLELIQEWTERPLTTVELKSTKAINSVKRLRDKVQFDFDSKAYIIGGLLVELLIAEGLFTKTTIIPVQKKNKVIITNKTVLILNENCRINVTMSAANFKPPLTLSGYKKIKSMGSITNNLITDFDVTVSLDTRSVHVGHEYDISVGEKTYQQIVEDSTRYCIDFDFFEGFLDLMEEIINIYINTPEDILFGDKILKNKIYAFLSIVYDLDFEKLEVNGNNLPKLKKLIQYALTFDVFFESKKNPKAFINEFIDEREIHNIYKAYYNRIAGIKYFFHYLLNDINIYKGLNHFYILRFLAYVGRYFSMGHGLNLQGSKLAHSFIVFRNKSGLKITNNIELFNKSKGILNIKQTFDEYSNEVLWRYQQLILSNFDSKLPREILDNVQKLSIAEMVWTLFPYTKKSKVFLHTISLLYNFYNENQYREPIYQKDASASGLQMISMFLHDPYLGTLCNLQGNQNSDLYQNFLDSFHTELRVLNQYNERFNQIVINSFNKSEEKFLEEDVISSQEERKKDWKYYLNELFMLLPYDSRKNTGHSPERLAKITNLITFFLLNDLAVPEEDSEYLLKDLNMLEMSWILDNVSRDIARLLKNLLENDNRFNKKTGLVIYRYNKGKRFITNSDRREAIVNLISKKQLLELMLICYSYSVWETNLNANPLLEKYEVLHQRNAVKVLVMTKGYGAGSDLQHEQVYNKLVELLYKYGASKINDWSLQYTAKVITVYFEKYSTIHMETIYTFRKFLNDIVKNVKGTISLTTKSYRWALSIYKKEEIRLNLKPIKIISATNKEQFYLTKRLQPILRKTLLDEDNNPIYDITEMAKKAGVLLAHSADKECVFEYLNTIRKLNLLLEEQELMLSTYVNHDNFGISMSFAVMLDEFVHQAYIKVFRKDLLKIFIQENVKTKEEISDDSENIKTQEELLADLEKFRKQNTKKVLFDDTIPNPFFIKI